MSGSRKCAQVMGILVFLINWGHKGEMEQTYQRGPILRQIWGLRVEWGHDLEEEKKSKVQKHTKGGTETALCSHGRTQFLLAKTDSGGAKRFEWVTVRQWGIKKKGERRIDQDFQA
ncbi:hypothetical protein N7540_012611 [Penicillium herquei]|nr:hypothetical protein N7540_012611 [Penicillium herquei]